MISFDQCPHRMACAKCDFYVPKRSSETQVLEGQSNLLRLRQEIPLSEAELAAVDEGVAAYQLLLSKLADVPTPSGLTPRQLNSGFVPVAAIRPAGVTEKKSISL